MSSDRGSNLSISLALLKKDLEALKQSIAIDLIDQAYMASEARLHLFDLFRRIDQRGTLVAGELKRINLLDNPIAQTSKDLIAYFEANYLPNRLKFRNASRFTLKDLGLGDENGPDEVMSIDDDSTDADLHLEIAAAFSLAMERTQWLFDDDRAPEEWSVTAQSWAAAVELMESGIFNPTLWSMNSASLVPISLSKGKDRLNRHVRERLREAYRSFIFGNYQSVLAMSRCLLEYCLIDRARQFSVACHKPSEKPGQLEVKRLGRIIEDYEIVEPRLSRPMRLIQDYGNQVMHPVHKNVKTLAPADRSMAFDCISALRKVIEMLYEKA